MWSTLVMDTSETLLDLFDRIPPIVLRAIEGLDLKTLCTPPAPNTNPIAWLAWHIARVQDAQIPPGVGVDQLWVSQGWASRFGLDADPNNIGYGHDASQVAAVRPDNTEVLEGYLQAVHENTRAYISDLNATALDRVVDVKWDPPVTLGIRIISVAADCLQHAGQAAYVRGLIAG
jgi:hypothetical protein